MNDNSELVFIFDGDRVTISKDAYKRLLKAQEVRNYVDAYGLESLSAVQAAFSDEGDIMGQPLLDVFKAIDVL